MPNFIPVRVILDNKKPPIPRQLNPNLIEEISGDTAARVVTSTGRTLDLVESVSELKQLIAESSASPLLSVDTSVLLPATSAVDAKSQKPAAKPKAKKKAGRPKKGDK